MEEYMTFDLLMEDLSSIMNEYLYDTILEDINNDSDEEKSERKDNIFKKFFDKIVEIMKFIGTKIRNFISRVVKYLSTIKSEKCVVLKDCEISTEIITGVQGATYNSIYRIASQIGKADASGYDMTEQKESIEILFKSEKKTIKAGTVLMYNIIRRNLFNIQQDHDKATNKIETLNQKIQNEKTKEIPKKYFTSTQLILAKYREYLSRIINETTDFLKNKVSPIVAKGKVNGKQEDNTNQGKLKDKDRDTFTPSETLRYAIEKKDKVSIKSCLTFMIKTDPTFKTNNFNNALNYVESKGISIKEPYKLMPDEEVIEDKSKWTEKYFYYAVNMLEENFALSRIPHIKAVGKAVFG